MRRTALRRATTPMQRSPMRRGTTRMGEAARRRILAGGPTALGRPSLSVAGTRRLKLLLVGRSRGACEACGRMRAVLDWAHVVPRSAGGADTWDNTLYLCRGCHDRQDAPYAKGKLLITAMGDGRFTFRLTFGSKVEPVVIHEWTGGRVPTTAEWAELEALGDA